MKTIIVITTAEQTRQSVLSDCREWQENYSIIPANNEAEAVELVKENEVDLIICDMASRPGTRTRDLRTLTYTFPYIPCITIINPVELVAEDILQIGVSTCLEHPFKNEELYRWTTELLDIATSGTVKGLPVHSLLQMLEGEGKTCTLKVSGANNSGLIFLEKGIVVAAETSEQKNEDAVYTIIAWENAVAEIKFYNSQRETEITKTLMSLIMEGFRLKDEKESLAAEQESQNKPRMALKHFSTAGRRLSLETGLKIKMELNGDSQPQTCNFVGMVPDKYLIVTKPQGFDLVNSGSSIDMRIVSKYLQMGRLCMFKTEVMTSLDEPDKLLFLDYPLVIHYHELRGAKRSAIFIPSTLQLPSGPKYNSVLLDLSNKGCLCQIRASKNKVLPNLDIGSKVFIYCLLPGVKEQQEFVGIVKNSKKSNSEIRIGIELIDLQEHSKETIERYLKSLDNVSK